MKLLVLENANEVPRAIQNFLHDNDAQFEHIIQVKKLKRMPFEQLMPLLEMSDAVAAATRFQNTALLERLATEFTTGRFRDKPFSFHALGFVHQLNHWTSPHLMDEQHFFDREFQDYTLFIEKIMILLGRGQLFNIEDDMGHSPVVDIRDDGRHKATFFKRRFIAPMPIMYHPKHHVFYTKYTSPDMVLQSMGEITRI